MPSRRRGYLENVRLNWKPATYLHLGAASVGATFRPAGLDKSTGIMSAGFHEGRH
jgi:hypothetical protein